MADAGTTLTVDAGPTEVLSLARICADSASASFARLVRCGELTPALAALYEPVFAEQCPASIPPGVADGRIVIDASAVQDCLARTRAASCLDEPPHCDLFRGTVASGGSCFESEECEAAFSCDTSASCPGTCVARVALGLSPGPGQECVKSAFVSQGVCTALVSANASCAGGLSCAEPNVCSASNVCAARPPARGLNEACLPVDACGQGLQCVNAVCVPRGDVNAACDDARRCKDGLRCSAANTCVVVQYGVAGAPCAEDGDACQPGFFCSGSSCAPLRPNGGACTDTGFECAPDLFCVQNVCTAPAALNAACGPMIQCAEGLFCEAGGRCANLKAAGAACVEAQECAGTCQGLRCTVPPCRGRTP